MKTFTIKLSGDAVGMLNEMGRIGGVRPEDVIRVCVESAMADSLSDKDVFRGFIQDAQRDVDEECSGYWQSAFEAH